MKTKNIEDLKLNKKKKRNLETLDSKTLKRKQRKTKDYSDILGDSDEYFEDVERFLDKIL